MGTRGYHPSPAVPPRLDEPISGNKKTPCETHEASSVGQSHSTGTQLLVITNVNTQLPDNGGVAVAAYSSTLCLIFGAQLVGPFIARARTEFTPPTIGSLNAA